MRQFIQNFKTGELKIEDIPVPVLREGFILVKNMYSLLSAGTEKVTVEIGRTSLFGKALNRPDLVKQVLQNIKQEGLLATLQKVKNRLETPKALGYSTSGVVIESRDFENRFKTGERVACAGQDYASHAEVISVPRNLVVKIPDNVSFEEAAFTTVGAIALHGVRQLDPKIGEKVCVIGLGLIGQLVFQILRANGCLVFGVDISDFAVEAAKKLDIDYAANRNDIKLHEIINTFTKGNGFDKVIIAASSADNDPVILSTEILRKKGAIVVIGNVKIDIPREPHFYKKELELKISTSYGPGRYDAIYEEVGIDYPYPYVRFTENRNMETFLELVSKGAVRVKPLITHIFDFEKSQEAYDVILDKKKDKFIGVLLKYEEGKGELQKKIFVSKRSFKNINIGFIGAGNFAQNYLLPYLKRADVSFDTVVTTKGVTAKNVALKFGFNSASTDPLDVINNDRINTVFIAAPHETHAKYTCQAIRKGKNVFVEKPLCIKIEELNEIVSAYTDNNILMVGFNRRFSNICSLIRKEIDNLKGPLIMDFCVNAGYLPNEHRAHDPNSGGGRVVGEVCHFIDLMLYLTGSKPRRVYSSSIKIDSNKWRVDDNIAIYIEFEDGSLGNIVYTAMGNRALAKERLEIFLKGNVYLINDFKEGLFYSNGRTRRIRNKGKGHKEEIECFLDSIKDGEESPIDFQSLVYTTLTTFKIMNSLKTGKIENIDVNELYS